MDVELLAAMRLAVIVMVVPFVVKGRYWWLAGALGLGAVIAVLAVTGVPREVGSTLALPLYALIGIHALDVTRKRHARTG